MRKVTQEELNVMIADHELWLEGNLKDRKKFVGDDLDFSGLDFSRRDLTDADFRNSILKEVNFSYTQLIKADFGEVRIVQVNFCGANCSEAVFIKSSILGSNLKNVIFDRCNMAGIVISGCSMSGAKIRFACLRSSKFFDLDFRGVDFEGSDFEKSKMEDVWVCGANWLYTSLKDVDFWRSHFEEYDLRGYQG